jgi:HipA-like C-terminal domain
MASLNTNDLINILQAHPGIPSAELCRRLGGINRSTLTRRLGVLGGRVISRGGSRRTAYALRRRLRGSDAPISLYRIDETGRGHLAGLLDCIQPGGTALLLHEPFGWPLQHAMQDGWFGGLPYPLVDTRPQGFLGRNFARHHAMMLRVSENPDNWSDDDILYVLSSVGFDLPGNLILGDAAYRQFLEHSATREASALSAQDIQLAYPSLASSAMAQGNAGSSAAGEFPKFTALRKMDENLVDVIVKFSGAENSAAVRRWADLLVCEHLALEVLETTLGIVAAQSQIYQFAGRTFLEVIRFDRHGISGRSSACTMHSLNAALLGIASSNWVSVSSQLFKLKLITAETARTIEQLWWFGKLIGNSDMHEGNLAFRANMVLTPAYDMLPMMFAPAPGGEVPVREFKPQLPLPVERQQWLPAAAAAIGYWKKCAQDERVSTEFRKICNECAQEVARLAEHV